MKIYRIFLIAVLFSAVLYLIFIFSFDKYNRLNEQQNVNNHANIISYSLWSFEPDLAKDYMWLACKVNKYGKLTVSFPSSKEFLSINLDLDNPVDQFLKSLSFFRVVPLKSKIFHKGEVIGEISVEWHNTVIYTYFYVLIIIILLLTIFWFVLITLKHKYELEERVSQRTVDLKNEIKERRQVEAALRESESRFRAAFDSAKDCVLIWDRAYNYLYANQAAIDHVGTTPDKVIGQNIRDGLGHVPEFMNLWISRIDKVFETKKALRVQDTQEMQEALYLTFRSFEKVVFPFLFFRFFRTNAGMRLIFIGHPSSKRYS